MEEHVRIFFNRSEMFGYNQAIAVVRSIESEAGAEDEMAVLELIIERGSTATSAKRRKRSIQSRAEPAEGLKGGKRMAEEEVRIAALQREADMVLGGGLRSYRQRERACNHQKEINTFHHGFSYRLFYNKFCGKNTAIAVTEMQNIESGLLRWVDKRLTFRQFRFPHTFTGVTEYGELPRLAHADAHGCRRACQNDAGHYTEGRGVGLNRWRKSTTADTYTVR